MTHIRRIKRRHMVLGEARWFLPLLMGALVFVIFAGGIGGGTW